MILIPVILLVTFLGIQWAVLGVDPFMEAFNFIMLLLVKILDVILLPFSILIEQFIPELDGALLMIAQYFGYAETYMGWIISAFAIPSTAIALIATYYLFTFTTSIAVYSFKLLIKWKNAIL